MVIQLFHLQVPTSSLTPLPDTRPESLPSRRCETSPPSTCSARPGIAPDDPTPLPPLPASPQTSDATGSTPCDAETSTTARSGSDSVSRSARAPTGTRDDVAATPEPRAWSNTWHGPDTG